MAENFPKRLNELNGENQSTTEKPQAAGRGTTNRHPLTR
jgi:hypothetical protein